MEEQHKAKKDKSQGSKKLFRSKSFRSMGNFMQRILKTLSSLSHLVDAEKNNLYTEDDDGGFKQKPHPREGKGSTPEDYRVVQGGDSNNNLGKAHVVAKCQDRCSLSSEEKVPGVQGLKNHGNTCFMNAVVQCLSNTDLLAEYLGMEQFRAELNKAKGNEGPQKASTEETSLAARGEVTERLASLVRGLWTLEYTPQLSVDFKNVVAKYGSQFRGNSQHDALEFLLWLLDRVHEDLNSPFQKPKLSIKPLGSDHGSVSSAPSSPIDLGQSFVQEHFQAQYRSSLTCPHCHKQSDTFDPFLCVSLPIPLRQTRALNVTLVFHTKRFLRIGLAVPLLGTVASLRQMVADLGNVPSDQVILAELHSSGLQRSFSDDEDLNTIAEGDPVYAIQCPPPTNKLSASSRGSGHPHSLPSSPRCFDADALQSSAGGSVSSEVLASSSKLLLLLCNLETGSQQAVRFGPPLVLREDRAASWDQLQQSILGKIRYLMRSDAHIPNEVIFNIRVVGAPVSNCYLSSKDGRPLQHPSVSRVLQLCGTGGPPHVKLAIEWEPRMKERLFGNIQEEVVRDDESVRSQQVDHQQQTCTLDECFQLYTKEEQLALDDAWRCPHCKVLQQGTVKLSLWTLPDILIIHLKRFRQVSGRRNKLSTLVKFPLGGLDMAPHVVKRGQGSKRPGQWSSWKQPPYQMDNGHMDVLYDLYAVCNHHGSLQGGHYTAYCRNSVDARWYSYDDSSVEHVLDDEVCTRGAYLLFYQKKNAIPAWSASSSVKGSISSAMSDHWVLRLNGSKRESLVSRATTNCTPLPKIPDSPIFLEKEMNMEKGSKYFVRGAKGRSASMKVSSASKLKLSISKAMPLRWSFGSKDRPKPETRELVEYLESGRRPKYTNESIVPMMSSAEKLVNATPPNSSHSNSHGASGTSFTTEQSRVLSSSSKMDTLRGKPKEKLTHQDNTVQGAKGDGYIQSQSKDRTSRSDVSVGVNGSTSNNAIKVKASSGQKGDLNQRHHTKVGDNRLDKTKPCESELDRKLRTSLLKKEPRGQISYDTSPPSDLHNGISRTFLSNGVVVSDGRTSGTMPRKQKEDLSNNKSKMDIRRAHSSSNVQTKAEWTMKRSASLYRNGSAPHQPTRLTATENASSSTLQRMKYQTSSLGRKKTVPESSF
ncbi:ubiquitin carboxyl-terminal hydrolase 43 isoform X2 [Eleutherodactylus coqui]|uniref:ubiquitin carboxyl-terminal hydrolase 43 isoform X2 n=1 Tax=Eleutherodactylus coqui TaxID=57060 RepID=UPI003462ADED